MKEIIKISSVFCLILVISGCRYVGEMEVEERAAEVVQEAEGKASAPGEESSFSINETDYLDDLKNIIKHFPVNDPEADSLFNPGGALSTVEAFFKGECIYKDKRFVSYRMTSYAYTGGAHGHTFVQVGILDRVTGEPKSWRDIIPEKDWAVFEKKVLQAAADELYKRDAEPLSYSPLFVTDNVYLDKKGLHFVYNAYEIACYAIGVVDVVVPITDKSEGRAPQKEAK